MGTIRILNSEPEDYCLQAREILESFASVDYIPLNNNDISDIIHDYHILIVRLKNSINQRIVERAEKLLAVATATTGTNHIDEVLLSERGISVISLKGETEFLNNIFSTAEHTFLLILCVYRNLRLALNHLYKHKWYDSELRGRELHGKNIGIIGYGRLGRMVAEMSRGFGINVCVFDVKENLSFPDYIKRTTLEELLQTSDIVSIHIPLNKNNINFIDKAKMNMMKKGSVLINTSRGEVIDESHLLMLLNSGHISGAGLDVLIGEEMHDFNPEKNPLIQFSKDNPKLVITPHIGGAALDAVEKTDIFIAKKIKKFMENINVKN
jgi:D-3-phosphoglycerate dehydrogenase / 2-oxoglutarate reductase